MPAALALPAFWGAVSVGVADTAGIVAGKMGANASREAANATVTATNHAADLQSQSNAEALAFEKQKDAEAQANAARTEQANYNQWAAREWRLSDFGQALGLSARNIPAYQPMAGAGSPAADGTDPKVAAFVADYQKAHPVSEGIAPIADALKKAGLSSGRFDYGGGNLSNNEVTVGGKPYKVLGGEGTAGAYWYVPGMNDGAPMRAPYAANFANVLAPRIGGVVTPALQMPNTFAGAF